MKNLIYLFIFAFLSNLGFSQIIPPYYNDFDSATDTIGWNTYTISGTNHWEFGSLTNSKWPFSSDTLGWGTSLVNLTGTSSVECLESPYFDLSDTSKVFVLNLDHYYDGNYPSQSFAVESSIDSGATWTVLTNTTSRSRSWYNNATGFTFHAYNVQNSAIELNHHSGQNNVKFRFKSSSSYCDGWAIYNLSIKEEENKIIALQGDSILGLNQNYPHFDISNSFGFHNQWGNSPIMTSSFYISNDSILDPSDILLGHDTTNLTNSNLNLNNWTRTFPMPPNLSGGTYFIIFHLNNNNSIKESNYANNISYSVMVLDLIFPMPYEDNFDSTIQFWGAPQFSNQTEWSNTVANPFGIEKPRSGATGWYSGDEYWNSHFDLESPYLDFQNSTNSVFCFWFKATGAPHATYQIQFQHHYLDTSYYWLPLNYSPKTDITRPSSMFWDCHCEDLSSLDGIKSAQLTLTASGDYDHITERFRILLDDIYVGPAKPDLAIEGDKNLRYTSTNQTTDTLNYTLVNSGLDSVPNSITKFYWSTDSILDNTDFFLGNQNEPGISDTTFLTRSFAFTKPNNNSGLYYILYEVDAQNSISEMRESDNIGFFKIQQTAAQTLPYYNDFESNTVGWSSTATCGKDEWQWSTPQATIIDSTFSGVKGFITNDTGRVSHQSRMHLMTPIFDLTQLQRPVLEFDMLLNMYHISGYGLWPYNAGNIMYSVDGGANWLLLEPTNQSYKRMYTRLEFEKTYGNDRVPINGSESNYYTILYGDYLKGFFTHSSYQGRDYENNWHYVVDLSFLQSQTNVQFMFVYANYDSPMEGMLIDNFSISEGLPDLMNPNTNKLMASGNDIRFNHHLKIKNNSNYISDPTNCKFYLSTDTLLNSGDYQISNQTLPEIAPYNNKLLEIDVPSPPGFENYNYLLVEIDPNNYNTELNETNNLSYLELNMDSTNGFNFPVFYNFDNSNSDGWNWYQDQSGNFSSNHRFALTRTYDFSTFNNTDHHWRLDPQYTLWDYDNYPIHFLESPTYDFTNAIDIKIIFDFVCAGYDYNNEGGRMEYSENGGLSWKPVGKNLDTNGVNWYTANSISSIGGGPGWTEEEEWKTAEYYADIFSGKSSIKFRFKFRSNTQIAVPFGLTGFKLDNFKIEADYLTILPEITICKGDTSIIFGTPQTQEGTYYQTNQATDSTFARSLFFYKIDTSLTQYFHLLRSNENSASYQWIDCSNMAPIPNETNQDYYPEIDGSYAVLITKNGCTDTSTCREFFITGIDEKYAQQNISVYPNPTDKFLTIDFGEKKETALIEITTTDGKQVYLKPQQLTRQFTLDFDYPSGIYFVRISIPNEDPKVFKVFKR